MQTKTKPNKERIECPFCRNAFYKEQAIKRKPVVMVKCEICGATYQKGAACPNSKNHPNLTPADEDKVIVID